MADENTPVTPAPVTPAPASVAPVEPPKTYTQDELQGIVARKEAGAIEKVLKDLGIPSMDDAKKNLTALKAWQDSQKTEAEKAAATAKDATDKLTAAESRALAAEMKADGLAAGIDPKKIDRAVKIIGTYDGDTSAKKVEAFLAENPEFKASATPAEFGGKVKNQPVDEMAKAAAELDKAFGLKPKK